MFRNSRFDKLLAKATSELLMEADWEVNLTICDLVRGQEVTAKDAIASLKKKLTPDNPHVMMLGLSVLEALMKNCGTPIHDEVLGTSFVLSLLDFISVNVEIRNRILGFIQNWEFAFKKNDQYSYLHEAYEEVLNSGYELPPFHESEAMFAAEVAPNWKDGDECFRCKATFTTFRRKHHCRNCGNVFCGECTTGRAGIPKYGIEKEVRVCELCLRELTAPANDRSASANRKKEAKRVNFRGFLEKLNGNPSNNTSQHEHNQQHQQRLQHQKEHEAKMKELRLREEEELQLALALSASEAESKQMKQRQPDTKEPAASSSQPSSSSQPQQQQQSKPTTSGGGSVLPGSDAGGSEFPTEVDPELARYLNRNYWLGKAASIAESTDSYVSGFSPSAPVFPPPVNPDYEPSVADPSVNTSYLRIGIQNEKLGDTLKGLGLTSAGVEMPLEGSSLPGVPPLTSPKTEEFLSALKKSLDVFCNRMRVCSQRGRLLTSDNTLQALFKTLHQMNLQLMEYSNDLESRRTSLEKLQDQTTQIRDARDALDALRKEYAEQRRREEEEAHRLRQIQMMQKVEVLRQQKRTALEAQSRQLMEQSMAYQQQQYGAYAYGYPGMPPPQPQQPMMPYGAPPPMGYTPDYYATPYEANAMMQVQHPVPAPVEPMPRPSGSEVDLQHPTTTNGTSDQAQQQQQQQQQQPVERKQQQQEEPFDLHPMMQSLPPPSHPQLEFAQPAPNPATAAAVNASIDQMPAPPTDDLPNVASAKTATEKPPDESATRVEDAPSPQLICLE